MNQHPHLKELYKKYLSETQSFRKVHRMIDWFESLIKTHTVVILAEYVRCNKFSENAKLLLAQGLFTPTLGIWRRIGQDLFKELEEQETFTWTVPAFREEYQNLLKALEKKDTNVIELRNFYAHGATPEDEVCKKHIRQLEPFLHQLIQLKWLEQSSTIVKNGLVYLESTHGELCLHPVLLYRKENSGSPLAFFNDLKNDKVGLLNYPLSKYWREEDFYEEFQKNLPLNDWKRSNRESFEQKIDELTESFKGRKDELENLLTFVKTKRKGYLSILGNPGIGKSTLIAQFVKELREQADLTHLKVIEYFINRGTNGARPETFLTYLIQKTDDIFNEGKKIRADKNEPWSLQEALFEKWRAWSSQSQGRKLLLLIDGLDEGTDTDLLTYLPRENFENILFIYGSRPGGQQSVKDFFHTLPLEHHIRHQLGGLKKEDIRSLIYEIGNKYEIERESAWINEVLNRSKGYPLYIKLLCDAIVNGNIALNAVDTLPEGIYEQYQRILDRYAKDIRFGNATLQCLYSLAAAKDYLNIHQLGRINHLDEVSKVQVGGILMEILSKKENLKDAPSFQLFHESFREYLLKEKKEEVEEAKERIIDFCGNWEELEGSKSQHYTLQHYASHLKESKKSKRKQELLRLLNNKAYIQTQKKVLRQFNATKNLLQLGLAEACDRKDLEIQMETALSLVDLKYEEANEAPQVIEMVANGEIDLALQRIESFGGLDEEGLKRKFILYMLCLAELTLLESKEKPFKKSAIDALLNHLDRNIPTDISLINWGDFFPCYLVFLMACEWGEMGLDYLLFFRKIKSCGIDWLPETVPSNESHYRVFLNIINQNLADNNNLENFSLELAKQGEIDKSIEVAHYIKEEYNKTIIFTKISTECAKQGKEIISSKLMQIALESFLKIEEDIWKSQCLRNIYREYYNQGKPSEILRIHYDLSEKWQNDYGVLDLITLALVDEDKLEEALSIVQNIDSMHFKSQILKGIAILVSKKEKKGRFLDLFQEAIKFARSENNAFNRTIILAELSTEILNFGEIIESKLLMQEAIQSSKLMIESRKKNNLAITSITNGLLKQGDIEKALEISKGVIDEYRRIELFTEIAGKLPKNKIVNVILKFIENLPISNITKNEALKIILSKLSEDGNIEEVKMIRQKINEIKYEYISFSNISKKLIKKGDKGQSYIYLKNAKQKTRESKRGYFSRSFIEIANDLTKCGKKIDAVYVMQEALMIVKVENKTIKNEIGNISISLIRKGKLVKALRVTNCIEFFDSEINALIKISEELFRIGKEKDSQLVLEIALNIFYANKSDQNSHILLAICIELVRHGDFDNSLRIIDESVDEFCRGEVYTEVSSELAKKGKLSNALKIAQKIENTHWKIKAFINLSGKMADKKQFGESEFLINEAIGLSFKLKKPQEINESLKEISVAIAKQLNFMKALDLAEKIEFEEEYDNALAEIALVMVENEKLTESLEIVQKINDQFFRTEVFKNISVELQKRGKEKESNDTLNDALKNTYKVIKVYYHGVEYKKIVQLANLSNEFSKRGKEFESERLIQKAIKIGNEMIDESYKDVNFKVISIELANQEKFAYALEVANKIKDSSYKIETIEDISSMMFEVEDGISIEDTFDLILPSITNNDFWKNIGKTLKEIRGSKVGLFLVKYLKSQKAQLYYIKGWAESLDASDIDPALLQEAVPYLVHDTESLEIVLQKYALHETFLGNSTQEQLQRFNQSLNIQCALDIVESFPEESSGYDLSVN